MFFIAGTLFLFAGIVKGQGFLHADGKNIVDGQGKTFISRSIGTGNWMIQEGYMMKSTDAGINTQWQFTQKLVATIGQARTDSFYNTWLANCFTKADVDSMKAWGFNAIRPNLHYKWFTLPIEDEPVAGEITWRDQGFTLLDSLVQWCHDDQMYLFLDMHGTPGGQGTNKDISDYDPSKPSLWESDLNKQKLIALWAKIADRYKDEPFIGGYDLINETNWTFSVANNQPLWDLFKDLTTAIREVDTHHMVILEGNWFANDYSGLPTLWDDNLVLSFHKYWTYNDEGSLDWMINLRDQRNVPLWLGESGENSDTWFTNLITLAESKNIGWSWWPVKKGDINNVEEVKVNQDYYDVINFWKSGSPKMTADQVYNAVMKFAKNQNIANCKVHHEVIDAMIRQPKSKEAIPFKKHTLGENIFFTDFDMGRNNVAYFDTDTADYHGSTDTYVSWNQGSSYRNDGVDIQACTDVTTNGYNVGWTTDGEWLQYTLKNDSIAAYSLSIRHASGSGGSKMHVEANGIDVTGIIQLPGTGDWQSWQTAILENIVLPAGEIKIKFIFDQGGSNLNYFNFSNPKPMDSVAFVYVSAKTSSDGSELIVNLNKTTTTPDTEINLSEFSLLLDSNPVAFTKAFAQVSPSTVLKLIPETKIYSDNKVTLSYDGSSVKSDDQKLTAFSDQVVENNTDISYKIPGRIQAENFAVNNGFELETCSDNGGGQNTGYANPGDFLDYRVHVTRTGKYTLNYRVATIRSDAELVFMVGDGENFVPVDTINFSNTGDWQKWETQSTVVSLDEGYYFVRLFVKNGEHNLNWFELRTYSSIDSHENSAGFTLYPNPATATCTLQWQQPSKQQKTVEIFDISGKIIYAESTTAIEIKLKTSIFKKGVYFVTVNTGAEQVVKKLIIN